MGKIGKRHVFQLLRAVAKELLKGPVAGRRPPSIVDQDNGDGGVVEYRPESFFASHEPGQDGLQVRLGVILLIGSHIMLDRMRPNVAADSPQLLEGQGPDVFLGADRFFLRDNFSPSVQAV